MENRIPRFTTDGVTDAEISVHPVTTADQLGLKLTRFRRNAGEDAVVLVHGLTSSSDIFIQPETRNLVGYLLDNGFGDVWTLDFRMSNHFPYNVETRRDTLDEIARYDFPPAVREIRRLSGARRIHVIAHCLGSVSFHMALFAGTVDGITSLVGNSVGLIPRVPSWSWLKLALSPIILEYGLGLSYLDPRFIAAPPLSRRWLLAHAVRLAHPECDEPACAMQSFMWGSGRPAMYRHGNLAPETHTHERLADLNGATDIHYYRHIIKMVRAGRAVKYDSRMHPDLPDDYAADLGSVETPILLLTGDHNDVFADSNIRFHRLLAQAAPGRHHLEILPGYGHIDPIIGKDAHVDVFPRILSHLEKNSG